MANETFRLTPITPTGTQKIPFSFMGSHNEEIKMEEIKEKPSIGQTSRYDVSNALSPNVTTIQKKYTNETTENEIRDNPFFFQPIDSDCSNWIPKTPTIEQTITIQECQMQSRQNLQTPQKRQVMTTDMSTTLKAIRKRESSDFRVNVFEEKICKFCMEPDWSTNLIRPCLCRGAMQQAHSKCVQNDIEANYMDQNKRRFTKRLQCQTCRFQYVIKTYKEYSLSKSLRDPLKFNRLFWLLSFCIILFGVILATIILVSLNGEVMKQKLDLLILTIVGCLVCLSLVLILAYNVFELIVIFEWQVMDISHQQITDNGLRMNQDELNLMLEMARQRIEDQFKKIYPYQPIEQTVQSPAHQTVQN